MAGPYVAVVIIVDSIWTVQNKLIHGEQSKDIFMVICSMENHYVAHKIAWDSEDHSAIIQWNPPSAGSIKINFDIAVKHNFLWAATVCRNHQGEI